MIKVGFYSFICILQVFFNFVLFALKERRSATQLSKKLSKILPHEIILQAKIGEGEFGTVYKGTYNGVLKNLFINIFLNFFLFFLCTSCFTSWSFISYLPIDNVDCMSQIEHLI